MTSVTASFGYAGISLGLVSSSATLAAQLDDLETQSSTGIVSDTYAGLGADRAQALSLQPAITQISAWSSNVSVAQSNLSTTQTALGNIQTIADTLTTSLETLSGTPTSQTVSAASAAAKDALSSLGGLLNTQSGGSYVFAGRQSDVPPVEDTALAQSSLAETISDLVNRDDMSDGQTVLSSTLAAVSSTTAGSPFSVQLSVSPAAAATLVTVTNIGESLSVATGVTATQGTSATATSSGSPIRDLMRNLMVVAALSSASTTTQGYQTLVSGLIQSNTQVTSQLTDMSADLGLTQTRLTAQSSLLSTMSKSLISQLGNAKDADLASVSTAVSQTKTQLEASYSLIADMKGMTLADYL